MVGSADAGRHQVTSPIPGPGATPSSRPPADERGCDTQHQDERQGRRPAMRGRSRASATRRATSDAGRRPPRPLRAPARGTRRSAATLRASSDSSSAAKLIELRVVTAQLTAGERSAGHACTLPATSRRRSSPRRRCVFTVLSGRPGCGSDLVERQLTEEAQRHRLAIRLGQARRRRRAAPGRARWRRACRAARTPPAGRGGLGNLRPGRRYGGAGASRRYACRVAIRTSHAPSGPSPRNVARDR